MAEKFTAQQMIDAIRASKGIKSVAARRLGCVRQTVDRYIREYATVAAAYEEERESIIDLAEGKMLQAVNDGEWPAIKFVLVTLGKERGYVERQQHEVGGKDGNAIEVTHDVNGDIKQAILSRIIRVADTDSTGDGD